MQSAKPQIEAPFVVEHESITCKNFHTVGVSVAKISIPRPFRPPFWHREVSAGTQEKWPFSTVYAHFSPLSEVATERLLYAPLQRI